MSSGLGELFIQLAFQGDTKGAETFKKKVKEVAKEMNANVKVSQRATNISKNNISQLVSGYFKVIGVIKSVSAAYNGLISSLNSNQAWINLTRQTDLALESLQGYANVANVIDKSFGVEGAAQSIASLEQKLYNLQLTGQGAEGFMYAGINPMGKNAFQIIEELRNRIKGLNNVQASFLLNQMGIDPKMLGLLRMTKEEFEELNNELKKYQLTDLQRKAIQQYQQQISLASKKIEYFKDRLAASVLPFVVKLTQSFARVAEGISKAAEAVRGFYLNLDETSKSSIKLLAIITGLIGIVIAFMANPVIASFVAILTAIYLIIDDIMVGIQGGDSYFRDFLNWSNEFVNNENEPKWIRDLIYILNNSQKLMDIYRDFKERNEEFDKNYPLVSKLDTYATSINRIINLADSIKENTTESTIYQTNYIQTSETANTILEELKHAQTVNQ